MIDNNTSSNEASECGRKQPAQRARTNLYRGLALALATMAPGFIASSQAQDRLADRMAVASSERFAALKLATPLQQGLVDSGALTPTQRINVLVRLTGEPAARLSDTSQAAILARKAELEAQQSSFLSRAEQLAPGFRSVTSTQMVLNAVILEVEAGQVATLLGDNAVSGVTRVNDYELDLSETVPYIGAAAVQAAGVDGSGVKVAVFDSGIDYYHAALGGSGDTAEYEADNPNIIEPGTFPTAKVAGGFDFTGSVWPDGPETPDPDPLDDGPASGHGTHVADIIAGIGGVAPGADLYSIKVCSSISSSCSGIALIQGMEYAVDPNGDGDVSDAMDIINMSLGSNYGQPFDDDLSTAVDNATALGVLTVASAGNSSDKPYITGTPSAAPTALSVAQTQVPSAELPFITVDGVEYQGVFQPFSVPPTGVVSGNLQYADGAGGNLLGCDPFAPGSLSGLTVLVDRGGCNFSAKISNISQAGGVIGIIGLVTSEAPFPGADGGDRPIDIPGYMVSQADSTAMKGQSGLLASVDPDNGLQLAGTMVGSSSRGPSNKYNQIKPEIGAPGASVSAIAGSGTGTGPFGGTSGAAPMVSGSAALLMAAEPDLAPHEVKARLINTGETDIDTDPFLGLAPITRIGGGEVRVDRALGAYTGVWDKETLSGALSFGFVDVYSNSQTLNRELEITNYGDDPRTYDIAASFRDPVDAASGAVNVAVDGSVTVAPGSTETVSVTMTINGANLPNNTMTSGSGGANPALLNQQEFDGYLTFNSVGESVHVPWQVLPRKSANLQTRGPGKVSFGSRGRSASDGFIRFAAGATETTLPINNLGVGTAQNSFFTLLATSGVLPKGGAGQQSPTPDIRAVGVNTALVPDTFCTSEFLWEFAINTWERQTHLLPVKFIVSLDIDQDGVVDYQILNNDFSAFTTGALNTISDGRQLSLVLNVETGDFGAFFFAEHATNTGNTVLRVCGEQVGLTADDILATNVDVEVEAFDFYFGGPGDVISNLTIAPLGERLFVLDAADVPGGESANFTVLDFDVFPGNSAERGLLLFSNSDRGAASRGGAREGSEAMIIERRR
ncbi:MAG: S8 family serine peptidase [Congregibacter sp.]